MYRLLARNTGRPRVADGEAVDERVADRVADAFRGDRDRVEVRDRVELNVVERVREQLLVDVRDLVAVAVRDAVALNVGVPRATANE